MKATLANSRAAAKRTVLLKGIIAAPKKQAAARAALPPPPQPTGGLSGSSSAPTLEVARPDSLASLKFAEDLGAAPAAEPGKEKVVERLSSSVLQPADMA